MVAEARYTLTSACLGRGVLALTPGLRRVLGEGGEVEVWVGEERYSLEVRGGEVHGAGPLVLALGAGVNDTLRFVREGDRVGVELLRRSVRPRQAAPRPPSKTDAEGGAAEPPPRQEPPRPEWARQLERYGLRVVWLEAGEAPRWKVYSPGRRKFELGEVEEDDSERMRSAVAAAEEAARVRKGLFGEVLRLALAGEPPERVRGLAEEAYVLPRRVLSAALAALAEFSAGERFYLEDLDLELPAEEQARLPEALSTLVALGLLYPAGPGQYVLMTEVEGFLEELERYARDLVARIRRFKAPAQGRDREEPPKPAPSPEEVFAAPEDGVPESGVLRVRPASRRQEK